MMNGVGHGEILAVETSYPHQQQTYQERTAARRKRQEQEKDVLGNLCYDLHAQERLGTVLMNNIVDGVVDVD